MLTNGTGFKSKYGADAIQAHMQQKQVVKTEGKKDEFKAQTKSDDCVGGTVAAAAVSTAAGVALVKNRGKIKNLFKKATWISIGNSIGGFFKKIPNLFKKENIKKVTTPVGNFFKKIATPFKKENLSKAGKAVGGFFKKIPQAFKKENIQKVTRPVTEFFGKIVKNLPKLFKKA
jgi:hypothetical protein